MKDVYVDIFRNMIKETQEVTGLELPHALEAYTAILLANYVERSEFLPERSFAETYLKLKSSQNAKELGDTCLFLTGVFPSFGESRYSINREYYSNLGISSYEKAAQNLNYEIFVLLSTHFIFLQKFIELSVSSKKFQSLIL